MARPSLVFCEQGVRPTDAIIDTFASLELPLTLHRFFHCLKTIDDQDRIPITSKTRGILGASLDLAIMLSPSPEKVVGHPHIRAILAS
tara:strand:- start:337 stop:600 length:264 start_codon:yes stop_codon:yes gene_type:complete